MRFWALRGGCVTPLKIEMLPARKGDAFIVTWDEGHSKTRRIVIDGGLAACGDVLCERAKSWTAIDLVVVTHVDADHIEGMVRFLGRASSLPKIERVWFNDAQHLKQVATLGPVQGEYLQVLVDAKELPRHQDAIVVDTRKAFPVFTIGQAELTVLLPTIEGLRKLCVVWNRACQKARLQAGDLVAAAERLNKDRHLRPLGGRTQEIAEEFTDADDSATNKSSIVFLLEVGGRSVLFSGDAHADDLVDAIKRLKSERRIPRRMPLGAIKVPHHGAAGNMTSELVNEVDCPLWIFSTNGEGHGHPHAQAIARIVLGARPTNGKTRLAFNYSQPGQMTGIDGEYEVIVGVDGELTLEP